MTVNLALVGSGIIARFHIAALKNTPACLHTICDVDTQMGQALAAETGVNYEPAYERVLANPDIGAVIIATPNHTHYELAKAAIEAGKDVFCEKPMTTRAEESADPVRAARQRPQQIFQVGYMKRYNPGFRLVQNYLPELGDLLSAHIRVIVGSRPTPPSGPVTWHADPARTGGGVLYHSGIIGSRGRIMLSSPNWQGTMPPIVTVQLGHENQTRTPYPSEESQWTKFSPLLSNRLLNTRRSRFAGEFRTERRQ